MIPYKYTIISFFLWLVLPCGVLAQTSSSSHRWLMCEPDSLAKELTTASGTPEQPAPLQVTADQGESSRSEATLQGNVRAQQGDRRLQASSAKIDREANRLLAEGDVIFADPSLAVHGNRAEWDLQNERGLFDKTQYYLAKRNAQGQAEQVRVDLARKRSRLKDATFSTCVRGQEFWQLRARQLDIDENRQRGTARDITLAIKDVPVMYFPYLSFPISDERQSGFLIPSIGYETGNGLDLRVPYYWNIAPNRDATLSPRIISSRGLLMGGEYRFLNAKDSGTIRAEYIPYDRKFGGERNALDIKHQANFLPNLYTDLSYEHVSDENYLKDLSNYIGLFTPSYLEQHLVSTYGGGEWTVTALAQRFQTIDEQLFTSENEPYDRLPQVLFNGGWTQRNSGLDYTMRGELVRFDRDQGVTGTRLDLQPAITLPLEWTAAFLTPRLSYRYTAYDLQNTEPAANSTPSRSAPVLSIDSGLFFDRPIQWRWWGNQADTQTLEPRLFYLYVPFRDQSDLPDFDSAEVDTGYAWLFLENRFTGADRLGDANQITAALSTRLLNSRDGHELLRGSIGYVHYFQDPRVSLENTVPEAILAPGIVAESMLYVRPDLSLRGSLEWDDQLQDSRRSAFDLHYDSGDGRLFSFSHRFAKDALEQVDISFLWPINERWNTVARWNYSLQDSRNMDALAGLEYRECCWALRMVARQHRDQPQDEDVKNSVFLELELTGLTGVGTNIGKLLENSILGYETAVTPGFSRYRY